MAKAKQTTKDAYYFKHDSNVRNDLKIVRLRREMGREASDVYFDVLCILREQNGYKFPIKNIGDIAYDLRFDEEKLLKIINDYELFVVKGGYFFSQRLLNDMADREATKAKYRASGSLGGQATVKQRLSNAQASVKQRSSNGQATLENNSSNAQPLEYSIVDNSKVDESTVHPPLRQFAFIHVDGVAGQLMGYVDGLSIAQAKEEANKLLNKANGRASGNYIAEWAKRVKVDRRNVVMLNPSNGQEVMWTESDYERLKSQTEFKFLRYAS